MGYKYRSLAVRITLLPKLVALAEIAAAFAGLLLLSALIGSFIQPRLPDELAMPVQALGIWGAVIAGALLLRRSGCSYRDLGLRRPSSWPKVLAWALAAILLSSLGALAIGAAARSFTDWPPLDVGYIRSSVEGNPLAYGMWIVLVVWGSAAFGEELLARGFLMNRIQTLFGGGRGALVAAVVGQAAIFGALHAIQGPTGILLTAYVGMVFAGVYLASGRNLWAPILAHGVQDTVSLTLMFLGMPLSGYIS
jgi:uncharacterized protein